jgi:hypothetical protein
MDSAMKPILGEVRVKILETFKPFPQNLAKTHGSKRSSNREENFSDKKEAYRPFLIHPLRAYP